ncbi:MAG TPA: hypothetical protein VHN17_10490 [Steroidobacteraceae bacterium]|jgi:hypothetical protein|nr:hypothetical protein [Steroidobacteraceae bacterium]
MAGGLATSARYAVEAGFTTARLMEYSERFLARAAQSELPQASQIAARMLNDAPLHRRWEHTHSQLMHSVAAPSRPAAKAVELRKVTFLTLHRKAPFEYMRDRHVVGPTRRKLIRSLFGTQDYAQCLVREHQAFLSSACSYLCAGSLCGEVLGEAAFCEALAHYERAYTEYYRAYGDSLLAEHSGESAPVQSLLPYLRYQLKIIREHMVSGKPQQSDFETLQALYEATGDTHVLPVIQQP